VVIGVVRHDFPAAAGGRFTGTIGDPNFLAAALVPAIILALGLLAGRRQTLWRLTIFVAVGILAAGFAATGSRGGLVAALVVLPAAIVLCKRQRPYLIGLAVASLFAVAVVHSLFPGPWERSASLGPGSGRGDLWTVAWHVARDHPITGVGLDNFSVVAGGYTRTVGPLRSVDLIAVHPHEVHNVYLQLLAELGIVGLVLFVVFVVGCLRAGWLAVKRFEAVGDGPGAVLANTIVLAAFSMLVSAVFISDAVDRRLWVLLALTLSILTASGVPQPSS
jgi:O-antigen ligase